MATEMKQVGERVTYRKGHLTLNGTILKAESNLPFSAIVYHVRDDASGRVNLVQPQQITR